MDVLKKLSSFRMRRVQPLDTMESTLVVAEVVRLLKNPFFNLYI